MSIKQDDIESRLSQIRENFKFFGAPVGMIVTIDKAFAENGWGHVGMFIQNICLSTVERGMGTCLQESWSIYPETVKDILNIPDNEVVWCGIALGYPNKEHPINNYRTSRESIEKFVTFIEWSNLKLDLQNTFLESLSEMCEKSYATPAPAPE